MNIPMLDDEEFERVRRLFAQGLSQQDAHNPNAADPSSQSTTQHRFQPTLDEYERITGFRETNPNALWHHVISIYGPPCKKCGKVLRTPIAFKCFECGRLTTE